MREEPRECGRCKSVTLHQRCGWFGAIALGDGAATVLALSAIIAIATLPIVGVVIAVPLLAAAWHKRDRGWICERCDWMRVASERRERRKSTTLYVDF